MTIHFGTTLMLYFPTNIAHTALEWVVFSQGWISILQYGSGERSSKEWRLWLH